MVNQNGLRASWACSSCMNNSHRAEFSSVWINAAGIHRRHFSQALIFSSPALMGGERQSISFESRIRGFVVIKHRLITGRGALWFQSSAPHCVSNVIFHCKELCWWAVQPLLACLRHWPALRIIQGRLFIRGIFSKPSPSTQSPASSQPCTTSWHAAAKLKRGLSKWKTPCCWDTVGEKERESSVH